MLFQLVLLTWAFDGKERKILPQQAKITTTEIFTPEQVLCLAVFSHP